MKLKELIGTCLTGMEDIEIKGITSDSRKVNEGFLFFAINGISIDGHNFAAAAMEKGAVAVVCEHDCGISGRQIIVEDSRKAYALSSAAWFDYPAKKLLLVGVTGTNGKTTVTSLLRDILKACGDKIGLIGTNENIIGDIPVPSSHTTPDAYELHEMLDKMAKNGCRYAIMEVSSHSLSQDRVYGLEFECGVFTNLTQDHLDYHGTMEKYCEEKVKLFKMCKTSVINLDDPYADSMIKAAAGKVVTYSVSDGKSDFIARGINQTAAGVSFELVGYSIIGRIKFPVPGLFSVYNSMAASVAAMELGVSLNKISDTLKILDGVKGRMEVLNTGTDYIVVIDYAHTPDGLENVCKTLNEIKTARLITLFGCGGDRDKTKRPLMGAVAAKYSDFVVVTSDNPRTESPSVIIDDIIEGLSDTKTPYTVIESRGEAIKYALDNAFEDDIVLLAGKGHETYQILSTGKIHFDEREIVAEVLGNK